MKTLKWTALIIAASLLLVAGKAACIYKTNRTASVRWLEHPAPPGVMVDMGGRKLYAVLKGQGAITVIIEPSLASASPEWRLVQDGLVSSAKVLAYDRAGYGWSDPGPHPRDARSIADDLTALIAALKLKPPFILLGHDTGALYAMEFARRHPGRVSGLVLVDPFPLNYIRYKQELETAVYKNFIDRRSSYKIGGFFGKSGIVRWLKIVPYTDIPAELRPDVIENLSLEKTYHTALSEYGKGLRVSLEELEKGRGLPGMPLALVTHSREAYFREMLFFGVPVDEARKIEALLEDSYRMLAIGYAPFTKITALKSSRNMHLTEPELIVEAVRKVVR
ncbi:MAG TPA: alpha/beta hydrolase [Spirochaetes bacterium]|nr:alpha/beta hydrolase [Spirochaetota bacterium]